MKKVRCNECKHVFNVASSLTKSPCPRCGNVVDTDENEERSGGREG